MKRYSAAILLCGLTATALLLLLTYLEGEKPQGADWLDIRIIACFMFVLFLAIELRRQRVVQRSVALLLFLPIVYAIVWLIVSVPALIFFNLWLGHPK